MRPPFEFMMIENTPLVDIKSKLENLLHYTDNQRVTKIEYHSSTIDNEWKMKFNKLELNTDANVKVTWSTLHRYKTKGSIKVDETLARSTNNTL